jgi:plastocyanin
LARVATVLLLTAGVAVCGCGSSGSGGSSTSAAATPTPKPNVTVLMKGEKFTPKRITIHKGQTVEWIDKDLNDHSVVTKGISSPDFAQDQSWAHTFTTVGVLRYHDRLIPTMKGTVVVKR